MVFIGPDSLSKPLSMTVANVILTHCPFGHVGHKNPMRALYSMFSPPLKRPNPTCAKCPTGNLTSLEPASQKQTSACSRQSSALIPYMPSISKSTSKTFGAGFRLYIDGCDGCIGPSRRLKTQHASTTSNGITQKVIRKLTLWVSRQWVLFRIFCR